MPWHTTSSDLTEIGILHRMRREAPHKTFLPVNPHASCRFMKRITLEKVRDALAYNQFRSDGDRHPAPHAARGAAQDLPAGESARFLPFYEAHHPGESARCPGIQPVPI